MPDTTIQDELYSASGAVSITTTSATTYNRCRAVYVGESADFDFTFDGTNWVKFQSLAAGSILPIQPIGARYTTGPAAPSAGSIVFLY